MKSLVEEQGITIGYSTLTQAVRDAGLGKNRKKRCCKVPDEPGAEMQHDTSPYKVKFAGATTKVQGSLLYFRYSKIRYLKFYRFFKPLQHEMLFARGFGTLGIRGAPLRHRQHQPGKKKRKRQKRSVITGDGKFRPDSTAFRSSATRSATANRKAGETREAFGRWKPTSSRDAPSRTWSDMNRQAFEWAVVRSASETNGKKPHRSFGGLRGSKRDISRKIPPLIPPPYLVHHRRTDQYGYAPFDGNYYWVPRRSKRRRSGAAIRGLPVNLPGPRVSRALSASCQPNEKQSDQDPTASLPPRSSQNTEKSRRPKEEQLLRKSHDTVSKYLDFATPQSPKRKHAFIRRVLRAVSENSVSDIFKDGRKGAEIPRYQRGLPPTNSSAAIEARRVAHAATAGGSPISQQAGIHGGALYRRRGPFCLRRRKGGLEMEDDIVKKIKRLRMPGLLANWDDYLRLAQEGLLVPRPADQACCRSGIRNQEGEFKETENEKSENPGAVRFRNVSFRQTAQAFQKEARQHLRLVRLHGEKQEPSYGSARRGPARPAWRLAFSCRPSKRASGEGSSRSPTSSSSYTNPWQTTARRS